MFAWFKINKYIVVASLMMLIISFSIFVIAFNHEYRFIDPDSNDYINLADNIVAGNGYYQNGEPEIFRAPGYSFFIVPFRYLYPKTVFPIVLMQIIINIASLILLWYLTLSVIGYSNQEAQKIRTDGVKCASNSGIRVAQFVIIFQVFSLSSIVFANKILTETLFTFLLLLLLLLIEDLSNMIINLHKNRSSFINLRKIYLYAFGVGFCGAFLIFVRAIFLPFFPLIFIYLFIKIRNGYSNIKMNKSLNVTGKVKSTLHEGINGDNNRLLNKKRILIIAFLILFPFLFIVGGWSIRNSITAGYKGFSSVGSINIYRYYACLLMAKNSNKSFADQQSICTANLLSCGNQVKQAKYAIKHGLPVIQAEPIKYLFLHLKSDLNSILPAVGDFYKMIGYSIGGKGTLSVIHSKGMVAGIKHYFDGHLTLFIIALPLVGILIIKYLFFLIGIFLIIKNQLFRCSNESICGIKFNLTYILYIIIILYLLIIPGAVSHPRFRVPVEPLLSLFAGIGLYFIIEKIKKTSTLPE